MSAVPTLSPLSLLYPKGQVGSVAEGGDVRVTRHPVTGVRLDILYLPGFRLPPTSSYTFPPDDLRNSVVMQHHHGNPLVVCAFQPTTVREEKRSVLSGRLVYLLLFASLSLQCVLAQGSAVHSPPCCAPEGLICPLSPYHLITLSHDRFTEVSVPILLYSSVHNKPSETRVSVCRGAE